jgi:hypothetical protein
MTFALPPLVYRAFHHGFWPSSRMNAAGLGQIAPFIADIPLEFAQTLESIQDASGERWGPLRPALPIPGWPDTWAEERLGKGSEGAVPDLPWLDVEQARVFGGGGWGDELWLVLDYRPGAGRPRVVANEIDTDGTHFDVHWRELAPSFGEFWHLMGLPDRPMSFVHKATRGLSALMRS